MKLRRVRISDAVLVGLLKAGLNMQGVTSNAPADLRIIFGEWLPEVGLLELTVSSSTFNDPADTMEPPPLWNVQLQRAATE